MTTMTCERARGLMTDYLLRAIASPEEENAAEQHYVQCDECCTLLVATRVALGDIINGDDKKGGDEGLS